MRAPAQRALNYPPNEGRTLLTRKPNEESLPTLDPKRQGLDRRERPGATVGAFGRGVKIFPDWLHGIVRKKKSAAR
jgi:hypothetical protein